MMTADTLVDTLKPLGFTGYEAKAYVALLAAGTLNGYELAKGSGVPRSMIYETIEKLQSKGAIVASAEETGRYLAIPPDELLPRLRREVEAQFDRAAARLAQLKAPPSVEIVWRIFGEAPSLAAAESVIDAATASLTVSIWAAQLQVLESALRRAAARGVTIRMILFGPCAPEGLGFVYLHHFVDPKIVEARLGSQLLVLAADHAEVVVANLGPTTTGWAVRTKDRALVLVAEEYIRHDVVLAALTDHVGAEVLDRLWRSREDLIPMVLGSETGQQAEAPAKDGSKGG